MIVRFSAAASDDFASIAAYLLTRSPVSAQTIVAGVVASCENLAEMPYRFPLLPRHEETGITRRPFRDYLIFYEIYADAIQILHVLHGAMDYERVLFDD